ncbi:hypothetical protein NIES2104_61180 [Leptolyngbya sp. NIES-2104]|nr:hypothetical protein NIES2104_61180 [Leptolyngbya sp. NIES-2104]
MRQAISLIRLILQPRQKIKIWQDQRDRFQPKRFWAGGVISLSQFQPNHLAL